MNSIIKILFFGLAVFFVVLILAEDEVSIDLSTHEWADLAVVDSHTESHVSEDFTIVGTVDGFVHAIDSNNHKKWSTQMGGSMISSHQNQASGHQRDYSVIPSIDGSLLLHSSGGMRKTSVKARMLVEKAPFVSNDGELIFTGHRKSKVVGLDVNSGEITHEIIDGQPTASLLSDSADQKTPLWIGRVDYTVRAFDGTSGTEQFNISYTELRPLHHSRLANHEAAIMNNHRIDIDSSKALLPKDSRVLRSPTNKIPPKLSHNIWREDAVAYSDKIEDIYHAIHFDSPAMAAFRVRKNVYGDSETYDVETLKVSNKAFHPADHSDHDGEVIEIRTSPDGGLYALQTDQIDLADYDSKDILSYLQLSSSEFKHLLVGRPSNQRGLSSPKQLYTTKPFRASLPLISSVSLNDPDSRLSTETNIGSECVPYPRSFKNKDEIDDTTTKILLDSKESDKAVCLVGHHRLLPGHTNDLPFLPEEITVDDRITEEMRYKQKTESLRYLRNVLLSVISFCLFVTILNFERLKRMLRQWLRDDNDEIIPRHSFHLDDLTSRKIGSDYSETIDENGRKIIKVGALIVNDRILGYGSHGTVVFSGNLNGRPVAVKRMLSQFSRVAEREMSLLIRSDGHPNVVRYFLKEEKGDFIYLALQLCCMSLRDFIVQVSKHRGKEAEDKSGGILCISDEIRLGLHQIAKGVAHLHSHRIVHRDLKPHNILCALPDETANATPIGIENYHHHNQINDFILKISDMGLSKQLDRDEMSFSMVQSLGSMGNMLTDQDGTCNQVDDENGHVGTVGWQAPELIKLRKSSVSNITTPSTAFDANEEDIGPLEEEGVFLDDTVITSIEPMSPSNKASSSSSSSGRKKTQNVDIFSLGCIFYFVLIPGQHPFGSWHEREANIVNDCSDLSSITSNMDAYDLIYRMLQHDPNLRPSAEQVQRHPFFWTCQTRLEFLIELSDRLEHEEPDSLLVLSIESKASDIIGSSWDRRLHNSLLDDIGKYRKYDKSCVRDLLRLIRNKKHHFHELDEQLKALMTPIPQGFLSYFESRFPKLFMHCVKVACSMLSSEKHFSSYCDGIASLFADRSQQSGKFDTIQISESTTMSSTNPVNGNTSSEELSYSLIYTDTENPTGFNAPLSITSPTYGIDDSCTLLDQNVIVWYGSALADKFKCKAWLRDANSWTSGVKFGASLKAHSKPRPGHLTKASLDFRYRSRLCTHWEMTGGNACPMRKKGKCDFAHGPLELRIKETRRDRWGKVITDHPVPNNYILSGGEDVLGAARSIEKFRTIDGSVSPYEKYGHNPMMNGAVSTSSSTSSTTSTASPSMKYKQAGLPPHIPYSATPPYYPQNMHSYPSDLRHHS